MHTTAVRRIGIVLLLACAAATPGVLAGCGGAQAPHLPDVTTSIFAGPKPRQATISITSKGDGHGVAQIVLTDPDGHRAPAGGCALEDGVTAVWSPKGLSPGLYECTIYAVTTIPTPGGPWLAGSDRTEENILTSKTFVIR
jgi:hypothetical protein